MNLPEALSQLQQSEDGILESYSERVRYREGECIFRAGSIGDCCYVIESGEVRLELDGEDRDIDGVLSYLRAGAILGEMSLLDREDRSASAFAHTDLVLKKISGAAIEALCKKSPSAGLTIFKALGKDTASKLRFTTKRLAGYLSQDEIADSEIQKLIEKSVRAQRSFQEWSEERLELLLESIADLAAAKAEDLALSTVLETRLGNLNHKTEKNKFAALNTLDPVRGISVPGSIGSDSGVLEICGPCGVIVVLVPVTAPVAAIVWSSLLALKARNSVVFSFPKAAQSSASMAVSLIQNILKTAGAPDGLLQVAMENHNWKFISQLLSHEDVARIVAFGGGELFRTANSSGKPVIGISGGAAPVLICEDSDLDFAAAAIINSKSFDNGLMPGSESCLIVDSSVREEFVERLESYGAAVLTRAEEYLFSTQVIDPVERKFKRPLIGQDAKSIARSSGISRNHPLKLIVVPRSFNYPDHPYCREIPAPVVSMFTTDNDDEALLLFRILQMNIPGAPTAYAYTSNPQRIRRLGIETCAARIILNSPATIVSAHWNTNASLRLIGTAASSSLSLKDFCRISRVLDGRQSNRSSNVPKEQMMWPVI